MVGIFLFTAAPEPAFSQSWNIGGNGNATNASKLGTTNGTPLKFFTNNQERMRIDASGKVGIGTTTPLNPLTVQLNGSSPASLWLSGGGSLPAFIGFGENQATGFNLATAADAPGYRPVLNTRRSRGTLSGPTVVAYNDYLASFVSSGYDGTSFQNPATIDFYVDSIPTAGNVPARISFVTGSNVSNRVERLKIGNSGNFYFNNKQFTIIQSTGKVGIGTDAPLSVLHVVGNGLFTAGLLVNDGGITVSNSNGFGVRGTGSIGVYGAGGPTGVYGIGLKYGVYGDGSDYGLYGNSVKGVGVDGTTGNTKGVGVFGHGGINGVKGTSAVLFGTGVWGEGTGLAGSGVFGLCENSIGVSGQGATGVNGNGVSIGVKGTSTADGGDGVRGEATGKESAGVYGTSATKWGVYGYGGLFGVYGKTDRNNAYGISGETTGQDAIAIIGWAQKSVGIYGVTNKTPAGPQDVAYGGYFIGSVGTTGNFFTVSDRKLKQDINDVPGALALLKKLKPKTYTFRHDGDFKFMNMPVGKNYGLIAQEVEEVMPELVKNTKFDTRLAMPGMRSKDSAKTLSGGSTPTSDVIEYKSLNYTELIPIIIKALQEEDGIMQQENQALKEKVGTLESRIEKLEALLNNGRSNTGISDAALLEQNAPNPFDKNTVIRYYVPETAAAAKLVLTNVQGQVIKTVTLRAKGNGEVNLNGGTLAAGTYNYSLWTGGKLADTKRLIIMK